MTVQEMIDASLALKPKKIVIAAEGHFALDVPKEVFTNPDLVKAVEEKNWRVVTDTLVGMSRAEYGRDPEEHSIPIEDPETGDIVGHRAPHQKEIDSIFSPSTGKVEDLEVQEVRGNYSIIMHPYKTKERVVDQVEHLYNLAGFQYQ